MSKILLHDKSIQATKKGIDTTMALLKIAIGPFGKNVMLDKGQGTVLITNDAKSIVDGTTYKDRNAQMGHGRVKNVCDSTNDKAGDGRKTAALLFDAIYNAGLNEVARGKNVNELKSEIENTSKMLSSVLKELAKPIKKSQYEQIATISAESAEIGKIVAATLHKVGADGRVTVEESDTLGITWDVQKGMEIEKGFVSQYMITDQENEICELKDVDVLVTDMKLDSFKDFKPFFERMLESGKRKFVVFADDIDGDMVTGFTVNRITNKVNVLGVKIPGFAGNKKDWLEDIATVTGATVVSAETGANFETLELGVLGKASRITSTKETTTIVGGKGKGIKKHIAKLRNRKANETSKYELSNLERRIASLTGGIAVIKIGAISVDEMKYKKLKIQDAVSAVKAAIAEGFVSGGGSMLLHLQKIFSDKFTLQFVNCSAIVVDALSAPFKQMVFNAGRLDAEVLMADIKKHHNKIGYDYKKKTLVDMHKAGIIDAVKIERLAIENACAEVALLLTTDATVATEDK